MMTYSLEKKMMNLVEKMWHIRRNEEIVDNSQLTYVPTNNQSPFACFNHPLNTL